MPDADRVGGEEGSSGRVTLAAVGDCSPTRRLSRLRDPGLLDLAAVMRGADVTWGNCEMVFLEASDARPGYNPGDLPLLCAPWGADELAWLGIDVVGAANNHMLDWGTAGLLSTLDELTRAGLAYAGAGRDLSEASRPVYLDSPAGRIAQVNASATFPSHAAAGPSTPYVPGRTGINPLHLESVVRVDQALFDQLSSFQDRFIELTGFGGFTEFLETSLRRLPEGACFFGKTLVESGEGFDLERRVHPVDSARLLGALAIARRNARLVMATLHCHESRNVLEHNPRFFESLARQCIDAGADVFFATGPHVMRGLEIYRGKPIFYSLGNFIFQSETASHIPAEAWSAVGLPPDSLDGSFYSHRLPFRNDARFWQSVVPLITFGDHVAGDSAGYREAGDREAGDRVVGDPPAGDRVAIGTAEPRLECLELYPITLGFGEAMWERGTPRLARGREAEAILSRFASLSEPFSTSITIHEGVGHVDLR